ncbi:PepSY-like domain-containing protein [Psychroserpens algicola]|uniref:PepSY-like domain-containing protein n=1 Tax=Psychroserpens algicola TaxID=1719034 RepID=A0ABT0HAJ8_9FLAO|nr:PepSY-like domain-containing protein [Psychroserpens algicola]MCK8481394.1 PepSY-like domain-containing protein [Psychroserpens algicola]
MKKHILFTLLITFFLACQNSSNAQAPDAVKKTFQKMYPGENDPDWHKDSNGNYESNFKIDGIKYRADYAPNGQWIETESSIDVKDLPKAIRDVIKSDYDSDDITEVEKVEHHSKGLFYDVEFKQKGKNKDIEFRANGEIINQ